ncbi:CDP-glycerol glycerophosphotransferase family protein [Vibrio sp. 10N.222.54.B12]|uniref:bifunctional glycosyltransferase/CDP-glycerol:glycerophosphate glycerophosphotransferase n=1 Tax=unclassified Vibrio TaxID=2614977 RepID=UPI0010BDC8F4|nr:CDP-glycerol glycerophosphotransferase family protein [Vibrio sp. F13]TKF54505.1 glycosyltransferase [Vibrio sp. F13]
MSTLSILIPVYNAEKTISRCIDSVLKNNIDLEIILIDDKSNDSSTDIINKYALRDSRIQLIINEENKGILYNRLKLIKEAKGNYLFFLDSDDYLEEKALESLLTLAVEENADVVEGKRFKISELPDAEPSMHDKPSDVIIYDQKDSLQAIGCWGKSDNISYSIHNKVIKTDLLADFSEEYSSIPDIFEDVIMNMFLIKNLKCKYIISSEYSYYYCFNPNSVTRNTEKVISSFDKAISYIFNILVKEINTIESKLAYRRFLKNIASSYIVNRLHSDNPSMNRMRQLYTNYIDCIARNQQYFDEQSLHLVISKLASNAILKAGMKDTFSLVKSKLDIEYDELFEIVVKSKPQRVVKFRKTTKNEIINYLKYMYNRHNFSGLIRTVYDKLLSTNKKSVDIVPTSNLTDVIVIDYPGMDECKKFVVPYLNMNVFCTNSWDVSKETIEKLKEARLVITSVPYSPLSKYGKGKKVFNVWHASGLFKKFGRHDPTFFSSNYGQTDYMICSSEPIQAEYADTMCLNKADVFPVGTPRTDLYFNSNQSSQLRDEFFETYPNLKGKKIYMYMPTYRELPSRCLFLDLDLEKISSQLNDDEVILFKHHPAVYQRILKKGTPVGITNLVEKGRIIDVSSEDTTKLTIISDVFITDYSSAFYEAMLLNKPIVFYAEDLENYERGFYFDYDELPGNKVLNPSTDELLQSIRNAGNFDKVKYDNFKGFYLSSCDGKSGMRTADVINKIYKDLQ